MSVVFSYEVHSPVYSLRSQLQQFFCWHNKVKIPIGRHGSRKIPVIDQRRANRKPLVKTKSFDLLLDLGDDAMTDLFLPLDLHDLWN